MVPLNSQPCAHPETHSPPSANCPQICHLPHPVPKPPRPRRFSPPPGGFVPNTPVCPYDCQAQVPAPYSAPLDPTGASHSSPWKVSLLRAPSSTTVPARRRPPTRTRVGAGHQRPSYLRRARRPRRAAAPGGAQRRALGSWPPGGRAGLRGPRADLAAGAAPAALKFPGRGREAQPHRLLKCAVGSNP